jgi:hypothetical protein
MDVSLATLRQELLRLHKILLDWERARYEKVHGRQSNTSLLKAMLEDPQFAWLRPMSQLIVRIDELLEDKKPAEGGDIQAVVDRARALTSPSETGDAYARQYQLALQESPDAVFAHRALVALLSGS